MKEIINDNIFKFLVFLLFTLNIFDTYMTFYWVINKIAYERNPIMRELLYLSPFIFAYVKLLFVGIATGVLWFFRKKKLSQILLIPIVIVYLYIFILHCNIAYQVVYN